MRWRREHGKLPPTWRSITGSGRHFWFKYTGPIPSSAGRIAPGIDVRGDGGYVIAPPSVHPAGASTRGSSRRMASRPIAPEWLRHACAQATGAVDLASGRSRASAAQMARPASLRRRRARSRDCRARRCRSRSAEPRAQPRGASGSINLLPAANLITHDVVERLIDACHRNGLIKDDGLPRSSPRSAAAPRRAAGIRDRDRVPHERARAAPVPERHHRPSSTTRSPPESAASSWWRRPAAGKTIIGADIINTTTRAQKRVLVLAHRREIIAADQPTSCACNGIYPGIIMAGVSAASARTGAGRLRSRRLDRAASTAARWTCRRPTWWSIDEATTRPAKTYSKIIDGYPDAVLLGLTATPCRGDGRGLGGIFETMIECPQVAGTDQARLPGADAHLRAGRSRSQRRAHASRRLRRGRARRAHGSRRSWSATSSRTGTSTASAGRPSPSPSTSRTPSTSAMSSSGPACAASTSTARRRSPNAMPSLARLASGEIEVVTNCMVLTEGWDMPEVGCCILARPTKKMGLYRQMIGRVLRPAEGKPDAIVLDHSGAVFRHGFVEDPVEWTLDPDRRAENPTHKRASESTARACSNARNAAPSASPASRASIADSCRSGRRARCRSATATRPGRSIAPRQRQRLRPGRARALARDAGLDRRRARLQARMGRAQVQGKVRHLAALGRAARADHADTRSALVGALAPDRLRAEAGRHEAQAQHAQDHRAIRAAHDRDAALARNARA